VKKLCHAKHEQRKANEINPREDCRGKQFYLLHLSREVEDRKINADSRERHKSVKANFFIFSKNIRREENENNLIGKSFSSKHENEKKNLKQ
jgi:hypothetical protein